MESGFKAKRRSNVASKQLHEIVGNINIIDNEDELEARSHDLSFASPIRPTAVIKITKASEIQELIKWANETGTPLIPVSSGGPHFHGDTVPSVGGSLILDLSGLKNIVRIDKKNRVTMIEPGVTFGELIPQLAQSGLKLNLPLLPRSNKSVIGSMLEREPVMMPMYQWDAMDPLTCVELIFGNGDLFRTGSASGPGSLEVQWNSKQAQVRPMGPGATDFGRLLQGAQGTLGIVTWATVRCEHLPDVQKAFVIGSNQYGPLADFVYRQLWYKAGDETLILNRVDLAAILSRDTQEYAGLLTSLPAWTLFFCLSGYKHFPEEKIAYQENILAEEANKLRLCLNNNVAGVTAVKILDLLSRPSSEPYWKLRQKGGCQDLLFLTTLNKVPDFVKIISNIADLIGYPVSEIGTYVQPMVQGTSCHCEFDLFYNPEDANETTRIQDLFNQASLALINAGAYYSRPYGSLSDITYQRDAESTAVLRKIKGIFDPNNIMNVGKLCF
jgi:FAD/FMN-containing dehydrogenase